MKIKLIAHTGIDGVETAQLFIYAGEDEEGFVFNSVKRRKMMFHHNPCTHSLREYCPLFVDRDDNLSVEFEVNMPFNTFCSTLRKSHFNNRNNFSRLTHNCSHAANYALELAGIKLPLKPHYFPNRASSSSYLLVPGFVLTPYELFLAAKKYKIQMLTNQKNDEIFQAKTQTLDLTKMQTTVSMTKIVNTIIAELNERLIANPHHTEFYIRAIIQTNDLLIQLINRKKICDNQKEKYRELAKFFRNTLPRKKENAVDYRYLILIFAVFALIKYLKSLNQSSIAKAGLIFGATLACLIKASKSNPVVTQVETNLSKAILNLSDHLDENNNESSTQTRRPQSVLFIR